MAVRHENIVKYINIYIYYKVVIYIGQWMQEQ